MLSCGTDKYFHIHFLPLVHKEIWQGIFLRLILMNYQQKFLMNSDFQYCVILHYHKISSTHYSSQLIFYQWNHLEEK